MSKEERINKTWEDYCNSHPQVLQYDSYALLRDFFKLGYLAGRRDFVSETLEFIKNYKDKNNDKG